MLEKLEVVRESLEILQSRIEAFPLPVTERLLKQGEILGITANGFGDFIEGVGETELRLRRAEEEWSAEVALLLTGHVFNFLAMRTLPPGAVEILRKMRGKVLTTSPEEARPVARGFYEEVYDFLSKMIPSSRQLEAGVISFCLGGWTLLGLGVYDPQASNARSLVEQTILTSVMLPPDYSETMIWQGVEGGFALLEPIRPELLYCFNQQTGNRVWSKL